MLAVRRRRIERSFFLGASSLRLMNAKNLLLLTFWDLRHG